MSRCVMVALLLASLARAQGPIAPRISLDRLKEIVGDARKKHKVPAMAAAVVTSKGIHAMTWLGVRKNGVAVGVTEDDKWHLGSDTKAFTAMLLAVLAEQGKLDLDDPLAKALGVTVPAAYKEVTLSQVMRHRGGLPHNLTNWWSISTTDKLHAQRMQAVKRGLALKSAAKPGEETLYSNLGYIALGAAAERAGGGTWEELVEKHVLKPLEIKDFGYGAAGTVGKIDQPLLHDPKGKPGEPTLKADNPPVMGPAGRLHMSLKDWAKFAQDQLAGAQGKGKLLKPEGYKKLHAPEAGDTYTLGGWYFEKADGFPVLINQGSNGGGYASAALMPTLDIGVLVVCNQGPKPGEAACKEAMMAAIRAALTGK
jgi:CubicO group peptidase (beta-lactamase class C family)